MKNKKTAWMLLPAVLLIWGLLGWKIYAAMKDDAPTPLVADAPAVSVTQRTIPDTYQLLLDYPDPFLTTKKTPVRNVASPQPRSTPVPPANNTPPIPSPTWPELHYAGLVQSHGKTVGFLSVNGESHFVKANDVIADISVQKIWKDSVLVVRGKEKRVVRK